MRPLVLLSKSLLVSLPIVVTFKDLIGYPASVQGTSMTPTLNPQQSSTGDVVWVSRVSWLCTALQRGDVVAAVSTQDPRERIVKRVLALEGDIISKRHNSSCLVQVPKGHCWLEGDGRHSHDSNAYGCVAVGLIYGKVTRVLYPPARCSQVHSALKPHQSQRLMDAAAAAVDTL